MRVSLITLYFMKKKRKNRKLVNQNLRNKFLNRRYSSLIKFFLKNLKFKLAILKKKPDSDNGQEELKEIFSLKKKIESLLDKSVKKNIFHKNNSSRKKSRIQKLINKEFPLLNFVANSKKF